jgi:hypothetical protein
MPDTSSRCEEIVAGLENSPYIATSAAIAGKIASKL